MEKCQVGERVVIKTVLGDFETTCLQITDHEIAINISDLFAGGVNWAWVDVRLARPAKR